jgi:signal transduction histidine kinase
VALWLSAFQWSDFIGANDGEGAISNRGSWPQTREIAVVTSAIAARPSEADDGYSLSEVVRLIVALTSANLLIFIVLTFLDGTPLQAIYTLGVPMVTIDHLLELGLWPILKYTRGLPTLPRWTLISIGLVIIVTIQSAWDTQLRIWVGIIASDFDTVRLAYVRAFPQNLWISGLTVAMMELLASNRRLRLKQQALVEARAAEQLTHMLALRLQLNPHFLFNALNVVDGLIDEGKLTSARQTLDRLSSFLRDNLVIDPAHLRPLSEEFDMLESYLDVQCAAFGDRIDFEFDLSDPLGRALIPAIILQPLVENSIKYAVMPSAEPVRICVNAKRVENDLIAVSVIDNGKVVGKPKSGTGVGLINTKARLELTYGERATVASRRTAEGFEVEIIFPLHFDKQDAQISASQLSA